MSDEALDSEDISARICATLSAAIFEGELKPGDKLKEDVMARHFGTSRTVVRGALSMLAQQRLAERRRNHGSFVAVPAEKEARDLMQARRVLEMAVMDALTGKVGKADLARLARVIAHETEVHAGSDDTEKQRIAGDFHYLLAEIAGNDVIGEILKNTLTRLSLVYSLYEEAQGCSCGTPHHQVILGCLEKGDHAGARKAMSVHLDEIEAGVSFAQPMKDEDSFLAVLERMTRKIA